jgi:hypothetical protein
VSNRGRDIVVLGCSRDVEALVRHLAVEAPAMLRRIIVIDPRPAIRERLRGSGVEVRCDDPAVTLRRDKVFHLSSPDDLHRLLRARRSRPSHTTDSHGGNVLARLLNWRFALLLADPHGNLSCVRRGARAHPVTTGRWFAHVGASSCGARLSTTRTSSPPTTYSRSAGRQ